MLRTLSIVCLCLCLSGILLAYNTLTGFSGAPGANGTCTSSCHDQNAFTPGGIVSGFPETYTPGQQYLITIYHTGNYTINQFNCSVRADEDSSIAGTLVAGYATEVYSASNETNGIHWETANTDSGDFTWTAPEVSTGSVTLYWAGLQGSRAYGADQQIVLHSTEASSKIEYQADLPEQFSLDQNYPNPFNQSTSINLQITESSDIIVEITNILGQRIDLIKIPDAQPGNYSIDWYAASDGHQLPSGMYFYQLRTDEGNLTRKMTLLR